jgi:purine-binding chemotaxis protein CheW
MASSDGPLKSELILDELKNRQRSRDVVDVEEERVKVMIFVCGGSRYAFYGSDIREILSGCDISWVPGLPDYLPGLINVRGDIESVIDIGYFLGVEKADLGSGLIAMAVHDDFRSGVMIDAIDDVVDIPKSALQPPLSTLGGSVRDLVAGEIDHRGETITLLDIEKLAARIAL